MAAYSLQWSSDKFDFPVGCPTSAAKAAAKWRIASVLRIVVVTVILCFGNGISSGVCFANAAEPTGFKYFDILELPITATTQQIKLV